MDWNKFYNKVDDGFQRLIGKNSEPLEDERLECLLQKLKNESYLQKKIEEQECFNYQKAYRTLFSSYNKYRYSFSTSLKVASVLLLLLIAGGGYYLYYASSEQDVEDICPGSRCAILVKQDGETVTLKQGSGLIKDEYGVCFRFDQSGLHYETANIQHFDMPISNTLIVPKGSEYSLSLSDGTQVWLNADSQLKYLVNFPDSIREVSMTGEAYFKVDSRKDQPFVVHTKLGSIIVTGTEFNVQAYPEKSMVSVTLVNGSISYRCLDGETIPLLPNQQLIVKKGQQPQIRNVDTSYETCWKEGVFMFQEKTLEEIFEQLERWYDCEVVYTNEEVKNLHFSGDLSRYKDIDTFITIFKECSDIKIEVKGKTILVGL